MATHQESHNVRRHPENIEFTPLAEPFRAPGGLIVEFPASVEAIMAMGRHFNNALENRGYAQHYDKNQTRSHVYQVSADGIPVSCGEIKPSGDGIRMEWDRAHQNRPGTPASQQAIDAFVAAANAGTIDLNYSATEDGFEPRSAVPTP